MQEEDYTFVTLDSDDAILTDAVIVDVDGENDLSDVVMIDESIDVSDFITLSDNVYYVVQTQEYMMVRFNRIIYRYYISLIL